MNDHIPSSLVEKVRKLLAVGTSSNKYEAELAIQRAKELATRYEIDLSVIQVFEDKKSNDPIVKGEQIGMGKRESVCQKFISWILQNHFKVKIIYHGGRYWGKSMTLIGKKTDIEIAVYINQYLNTEFMRLWHEFRVNNPSVQTKDRNSFLWGLYEGLVDKIKESEQKTETIVFQEMAIEKPADQIEHVKQCYALAKIDYKKELNNKLEEFYPKLRSKTRSYNFNYKHSVNALSAGKQAGKKISLRRGITGGQSNLIQN